MLLSAERQRSFGRFPWWFFYVAGAALVVGLPLVMWMRSRIGTAVLGAFVTLRVLFLVMRIREAESPRLGTTYAVFAGISALTALMLWRAVLSHREPPQRNT